MKKMKKKCLAFAMVGCMMLGMFSPYVSYAAEIQETDAVVYEEAATETVETEMTVIPESEVEEVVETFETETETEETSAIIGETEIFPEEEIEWLDAETFETEAYDFSNVPKDYEVSDDAESLPNHRDNFAEDGTENVRLRTLANDAVSLAADQSVKAFGVDVSKHNGVIDWAKVKAAGVKFAIIRVGGRGYGTDPSQGQIYEDSFYRENLKGAIANGINVGVYFFSTAINEKEAIAEAQYTVNAIKDYKITYPVVYDCEEYDNPKSRNYNLSNRVRTNNALAFLKYVEDKGYKGMMYSSSGHFRYESRWETSRLDKDYDIWVANYPYISIAEDSLSEIPNHIRGSEMMSSYEGVYRIWQCSSKGRVDGINGNVDLDIEYGTPEEEAYTGFVWYDGVLHYVVYDMVDESCTGIFEYNGEYYYMEKGVNAYDFTGLVGDETMLCVIKDGKVDESYTGEVKTEDGVSYYAVEGIVDLEAILWVNYKGKDVCVKYGMITSNYTGLAWAGDEIVYIKNDVHKTDFTGLVSFEGDWYYIRNGVFDVGYTGLCKYYSTWYYVADGCIDWNYTGLTKYYSTWYYVQNGIMNLNYTGLTKYYSTWYYVQNGILNLNYTGLTKYYSTWYYVQNGILDTNYTGPARYYSTTYYVRSGKLDFGFSGWVVYKGQRLHVVNGVIK